MTLNGLRYPGLWIALVVALLVWSLSQMGAFVTFSGMVYDQWTRQQIFQNTATSQVVVVRADLRMREAGDEFWLTLLQRLQSLTPARIIFSTLPEHVSPTFYRAAAAEAVVFGRQLERDTDDGSVALPPLPSAAEEAIPDWGVLTVAASQQGIHRLQHSYVQAANAAYPALEFKAALVAGRAAEINGPYRVNFLGGADRIPVLSAQRVVQGGVVPELVSGKHVLVGFVDDVFLPGVHTPVSGAADTIPLLMFQGYALDTLLRQQIPTTLPSWLTLMIVLLIAAFSVFIYQWLSLRIATWVSLALAAVYVLSAGLLLISMLWWLPVVEMVMTQALMFAVIYRHKAVRDEQGLRQIVLTGAARVQEHFTPPNFYSVSEHWGQVINLVNQTLDLNRAIFLERIPGDHRLREIRALNCALEDIKEQRRDYERTPYSTAIEANGPIKLDERMYMEVLENEDQYLVPLLFAGDVLGFWAFGVEPAKAAAIPMFDARVRDFGQQISELLYHRQQWLARQSQNGFLGKYLRIEPDNVVYKALRDSTELMGRRLRSLEDVFDGLGTATVLYDLFGSLMQANKRMVELLQSAELPAYDMTALDLITAVSDMEAAQARQALRYVVLERGTVTLPARVPGVDDVSLVLNIRPLIHSENASVDDDKPRPFELVGILFELMDVTNFRRLYRLKEQLMERLNISVRNDMESIVLAVGLLLQEQTSRDKQQRVGAIAQEKVAEAVESLEQAQRYLDLDVSGAPLERYPIEPRPLAEAAVTHKAALAHERKVVVTPDTNVLVGMVLAEPVALTELLQTLLAIVIDDAMEESEVTLVMRHVGPWVMFEFKNVGFGIPNERLHSYLFGTGDVVSDEFKKLRAAMATVRKWEGELEADSEVGVGVHFVLKLRGFL